MRKEQERQTPGVSYREKVVVQVDSSKELEAGGKLPRGEFSDFFRDNGSPPDVSLKGLVAFYDEHRGLFDQYDLIRIFCRIDSLLRSISHRFPVKRELDSIIPDLSSRITEGIGRADLAMRTLADLAQASGSKELQDPALMKALADKIVQKDAKLSCTDIVFIVRSFARNGIQHKELMEKLCAETKKRIAGFKPNQLAIVVWSCAKLRWKDEELFGMVAERFMSEPDAFGTQSVVDLALVFQESGMKDPALFECLTERAKEMLQDFRPNQIASLSLSLARACVKDREFFDSVQRIYDARKASFAGFSEKCLKQAFRIFQGKPEEKERPVVSHERNRNREKPFRHSNRRRNEGSDDSKFIDDGAKAEIAREISGLWPSIVSAAKLLAEESDEWFEVLQNQDVAGMNVPLIMDAENGKVAVLNPQDRQSGMSNADMEKRLLSAGVRVVSIDTGEWKNMDIFQRIAWLGTRLSRLAPITED